MQNISAHSLIGRNPDIAWRYLGEYLIAITPKSNQVHRLNSTGANVWRHLEGGKKKLEQLIQDICSTYEVDSEAAAKDIRGFIAEIESKGLVEVSEGGKAS